MSRTVRNQPKLPSPDRVALVNRGGKGFHGGGKREHARRERVAARQSLRKGDWS